MSQTTKISRNNTKISHFAGRTVVTLHSTDIVDVTPDTITLNTGGWNTATTRTRMNQVSNEMGLGYAVGMSKGRFIVRHHGEDHTVEGSVYTFNR